MSPQVAAISFLLPAFAITSAAEEIQRIAVKFKPGTDSAEISGSISGHESRFYELVARDGQFLTVDMTTDNASSDFNIYLPGRKPGDEALFSSAMADKRRYTGQLFKDGAHGISVFLNRNAARKNATANFKLSIRISDEPPAENQASPPAGKFSKKVHYDKVTFTVTFPADESANSFTIASSGLTEANDRFTVKIQGRVTDVLCDDIDGDNSPEVAVIIEHGPHAKRSARIFSAYNQRSFGMVNFQDVSDEKQLAGYRGGDEFQFVENTFIRRFPLHQDNEKTGKTRQFQFKMEDGEAMKQLKLDRTVDF